MKHERARRFDTAVQIDRAQKRLGRVGQDGRALSAAAVLLAVTQTDLLRNAEFPRDLAQRTLTHDRRTQLGQLALGQLRIMREQVIRRDKAQYGIAKKLQPLVAVQMRAVVLVGIRGMRHRFLPQADVLEFIVDFEHGFTSFRRFFAYSTVMY